MTATAVSINAHFFEVLQNNEHPSFTIYDDDPIAGSYAPYCMINNFETALSAGEYQKVQQIIDYESWADWFILSEYTKNVDATKADIESVFGEGSAMAFNVRPKGAILLDLT